MFRVTADSLRAYLDFDARRKADLLNLRMNMIGYGRSRYATRSAATVAWPVIGVALQKNYISVYLAVTRDGLPLVQAHAGTLGERRAGRNNFSFGRFDELNAEALSTLFAEAAAIFRRDAARAAARSPRAAGTRP